MTGPELASACMIIAAIVVIVTQFFHIRMLKLNWDQLTRRLYMRGKTPWQVFSELNKQLEDAKRFRAYSEFEELAPPDVDRPVFVQWCFDAWETYMTTQIEMAELRDTLETLLDEQNGPPLIRRKAQWEAAVAHAQVAVGRKPIGDNDEQATS